jgi:hypothetical protein
MLLGLAAASTAAATLTVEASATPAENPILLDLAAQLLPIGAAYHEARRIEQEISRRWERVTPWAPDELTVPGIAWPSDDVGQPGNVELKVLGGYLWRKGDNFPRRIVITSGDVRWDIYETKRARRKAKKDGNAADYLHAENEIARLKKLGATASAYEAKFAKIKAQAKAEHDQAWPIASARQDDLEKHVAAIMDTPDWTMEGLIIKAQALAEWDRVGCGMDKVAFKHGREWHGQIAASILRHAGGVS